MFRYVLCLVIAITSPLFAQEEIPTDDHFVVQTLAEGFTDPMEIAILPNGDSLIIERMGAIKLYSISSNTTTTLHQLDVIHNQENKYARESGGLGITLDPQFSQNKWIYIFYSPTDYQGHYVSRFSYSKEGLENEKMLLKIHADRENSVCHEGGSLAFGPQGNLFISVGDNTCPFESKGSSPLDERDGRHCFDAQRSASNTNDLRGSILRIRPTDEGSYTIPDGNLYPKGTAQSRPELYAMGCRNPWRISIDPKNGWLFWGDVGPDAGKTTERGPRGYCEINQAQKAGYFGWPYFIGKNISYTDYDFSTNEIGDTFHINSVRNESTNNTGITRLPRPQPAFRTVNRSCHCAGPILRKDSESSAIGAFPPTLTDCLITYDWNNGHITIAKLNADGSEKWTSPFLRSHVFIHPGDMELGPDRALYVLEYGSKWRNNTDGKLIKITYSEEKVTPSTTPAVDPRLAGMDITHPGTQILANASLCLSCHQSQVKSVGPSYLDVANKYKDDSKAIELLMEKIQRGGVGTWGNIPMPPQTQYNDEQLSQIVEAILKLGEGHQE